MTVATQHVIAAAFANRADAENAISELKASGISEDDIGLIVRDDQIAANPEPGAAVAEGAAAGAVTGAGIGALWALGVATSALPAIGPVIAGGTLAAVLASAAGGAAVASLFGALIGLGLSEEEARFYESEVHSGRSLVTVRKAVEVDRVAAILRNHGGYNLQGGGVSDSDPYQNTLR